MENFPEKDREDEEWKEEIDQQNKRREIYQMYLFSSSFLFYAILGHVSEQFQGYYFDIDLTSKRLQENYFQHS